MLGLGATALFAAAPLIMVALGAVPDSPTRACCAVPALHRPYLLLMACFIALGGVIEGSGGAPELFRVTLLGSAVQLSLAHALSGLGLPGVCLAPGLAMAVQCAAVAVLLRRARSQAETGVSLVRWAEARIALFMRSGGQSHAARSDPIGRDRDELADVEHVGAGTRPRGLFGTNHIASGRPWVRSGS